MLVSMTGCGEAHHAEKGVSYSLEIRTFNNRYLKTTIKLPETLQFLEDKIEKQLRKGLGRGSVIYQLRVRDQRASAAYSINVAALQSYVDQVCQAKLPDGVKATVDLGTLAALPGVCQPPEPDESVREQQATIVQWLTERALDEVVAMIPPGATVYRSGSMTTTNLGLWEKVAALPGVNLLDPYLPGLSPEEGMEIRRRGMSADVMIASSNAITLDGKLVNLDGMGNRVAAMIFGPTKVILVVGVNKITPDLESAMARVKHYAAPINSMRINYQNPCVETGLAGS